MVITQTVSDTRGARVVELDKYLSSIKPEEPKEEVYTPYEHLRTLKPNADFYALEYTVDVKKDILGEQ